MEHQRFDNRLSTIEEHNAAIQGTLHQYSQWQATMGNVIANIQQQQQHQNQNWDLLFQEPQHLATILNDYANIQLGEGYPPCIQGNF